MLCRYFACGVLYLRRLCAVLVVFMLILLVVVDGLVFLICDLADCCLLVWGCLVYWFWIRRCGWLLFAGGFAGR